MYIRLPLGVRVALEYEVFGKVVVNVYHVTTTDPIVTIKLIDIAELFEAWWTTSLSGVFSEDIALTAVTALNLNEADGEKQTVIVSPPVAGNVASPALSNNVAIVASFGTAKTGRSFRGRVFLAGLPENGVTANHIDSTRATNIIGDFSDLQGVLFAADVDLVVASFQHAGQARAEGVATPVENIAVNLRVDTQRRRLPKN